MCTCKKLLTLCDCDVTDCDDHAMSCNIVWFCVHNWLLLWCNCNLTATRNKRVHFSARLHEVAANHNAGRNQYGHGPHSLLTQPPRSWFSGLPKFCHTDNGVHLPSVIQQKWHPAAKVGEDKIRFVPTFSEVGGDMSHGSHVVAAPTAVHVVYHHQVLAWLSVLTKM